MARPWFSDSELERLLFPTLRHFMQAGPRTSTTEIARRVCMEVNSVVAPRLTISREQVYPLVRLAVQQGLLEFKPPRAVHLSERLERLPNRVRVTVLDQIGWDATTSLHLADAGAQIAVDAITQLGRDRAEDAKVHVGLGIGRTCHRVARRVGSHLQKPVLYGARPASPPRIEVHALSPAYSVWDPLESPIAAFGYFSQALGDRASFAGLFGDAFVSARAYSRRRGEGAFCEARRNASQIDILITGLASSGDPHGYLRQCLTRIDPKFDPVRHSREAVGDVHLRPYSMRGPVTLVRGLVPVTLFELDELVAMAATPGKTVILLCGPCGVCTKSKAGALLPLLTTPGLRVFNHLVIDARTAGEVLALHENEAPPG